jgi:predicted amidophosphoribosyltransferase
MHWPTLFFCPGCLLPSMMSLCDSCKRSIQPNSLPFDLEREGLETCYPVLISAGTTRNLLRRWKEKRGNILRSHLFRMDPALQRSLFQLDVVAVVPIPQSPNRSERRGHASSREVARFIAERIDRPLVDLLDLQKDDPAHMTGKSRFERDHSPNPFRISENFSAAHPLFQLMEERVFSGKDIPLLLVDDLITSGATLARAATVIHGFLPRARIYPSGLGLRPPVRPERPELPESEFPSDVPEVRSRSDPDRSDHFP